MATAILLRFVRVVIGQAFSTRSLSGFLCQEPAISRQLERESLFVWRNAPGGTSLSVVPTPSKPRLTLVKSAPAEPASPRAVLDDAELLAGMQRGDADSAEALYDRLRPRVESTVRRLLGRGDPDHDDCVQNAFVELVRSVDGYRGECSLEHWVAQIAARVVYRQIRQRKLYRRHFDTPAETPDRAEPVDASRRLVARDLFARIRAMLGAIETDNTYTFMLHDVVGFDLREIAQITGVSVAAAQQRLIRGRRAVHAHLRTDDLALGRELEEWT